MTRWRPFAYAALLAACAIPDLDTSGAIRCGTEGACPDGYQCRIGRCCPAGAPLNACPAIPAGTPGAPCTGTTCTVNLGARQVAGNCVAPFPGGYCTVAGCDPNNSDGTCGAFAACVPGNTGANCIRRCGFDPERPQPQPCRDLVGEVPAGQTSSYVCIKDPYDRTATAGLCVPDCMRFNWCGANTMCDAATRSCAPPDCRRTPGVCEATAQSCRASNGACVRCGAARNREECAALGEPCALATVAGQAFCRQACSVANPCPTGALCVLGVCSR